MAGTRYRPDLTPFWGVTELWIGKPAENYVLTPDVFTIVGSNTEPSLTKLSVPVIGINKYSRPTL